jgi:hypothetical protein
MSQVGNGRDSEVVWRWRSAGPKAHTIPVVHPAVPGPGSMGPFGLGDGIDAMGQSGSKAVVAWGAELCGADHGPRDQLTSDGIEPFCPLRTQLAQF